MDAKRRGAPLDKGLLGAGTEVQTLAIERYALAHDASHYLLVPDTVVRLTDVAGVAGLFAAAQAAGRSITFRSGGTSLSGQGVTDDLLVETRSGFRGITPSSDGQHVSVEPGATVRQVNARLLKHGRKLGPDPASEIACTIGGVVANNSSGMACGITENSYQTIESLVLVLPSGTTIDTADVDVDDQLRTREPDIHAGLLALRERLISRPDLVSQVTRQYAMKNTMGYGLNALLDYSTPAKILEHLVIGSEGTLAFIAEARFRTIPVLPAVSTGLLIFECLSDAMAALPMLVDEGFATIELMDAASLRVAQGLANVPAAIAGIDVDQHASLLVELHATDDVALTAAVAAAHARLTTLPLATPATLSSEATERALLWSARKGLFTAVAGARPGGTTALLEDIVVPVPMLLDTCERLIALFRTHGYEDSVIFGHAKDGNVHFLINERFGVGQSTTRYQAFTEDLVDLVLGNGGSLKAEHGTGRIMAPFVRRQFGDELTDLMWEIKRLIDPTGMLNPGVVLSETADSYLRDLKVSPRIDPEVDRCVECGYCEPTCPSKDVTLTPRQRIVLRRDIAAAEAAGDRALVKELSSAYEYEAVQTCAVDGMCAVACPVTINTGDLMRRLRAEKTGVVERGAWKFAATHWDRVTRAGATALSVARTLPAPIVRGATKVGRTMLGSDRIPLYEAGMPSGAASVQTMQSKTSRDGAPEIVFFAACIGSMFGPADEGVGSSGALWALLDRAGIGVTLPESAGGLCCGTPWKSKGMLDGYGVISDRVLDVLWRASRGGAVPIVCDAASCTEGLEAMVRASLQDHPVYSGLVVEDATTFVAREVLPRIFITEKLDRIAVHPTCSTMVIGSTPALTEIAASVAHDVVVPLDWGCCAFAGDRGMLHPELTASATDREAAELEREASSSGPFDAYVSANRTCEIGMTRATGQTYRHVLELLEELSR